MTNCSKKSLQIKNNKNFPTIINKFNNLLNNNNISNNKILNNNNKMLS